jgi:hypothetical protein
MELRRLSMRNLNKTLFVWLLLATTVCVWIALAAIRSVASSDPAGLLRLLPTVVVIDCGLIGLFVKWGWRWRLLYPWLVPFPDLNGMWKGTLHSTYVDPKTGERAALIKATLAVRQTFTDISCVMRTDEMTSSSGLAGFVLDKEQQQKQLVYTYCSRPKLTLAERSTMHDGTIVFDIVGDPPARLSGHYWTTRGTAGEAELKYIKNNKALA